MGGNKSKPAVESARSVLMRRGKEESQKVSDTVNTVASSAAGTSSNTETVTSARGPKANAGFDPVILSEMSKWSVVRSSDKPPKQVVSKGEPSAAIIRMKEIKEREGLSPSELKLKNIGRLSEDEMILVFKGLRTDFSNDNIVKLANQFKISQLNIEMLHKYYRNPIVHPPKEGEMYPVAS